MKWFPILVAALLAPAVAGAQHGPSDGPTPDYRARAVSAAEAERWREDLTTMAREMERLHADLYHSIGRQAFADSVASLHARIPRLSAHEIVVELARVVALIGDGHTSLPLDWAPGVGFHALPVRFGLYPDGLYVEAADGAYEDLVGGRVVSIGRVPVERVVARARPLVSHEAAAWVDARLPRYLERIEVLHALGLAEGLDGVVIAVERDDRPVAKEVAPLADPPPVRVGEIRPVYTADWEDAAGERSEWPVSRGLDSPTVEYLPEDSLLWIGLPAMANEPEESARAFFRRAMNEARDRDAVRVVVDLRENVGGEGGLVPSLVREIVRAREIDVPGRFFVAVGRHTFSAAMLLTTDLERYTVATFVGEPTGASPNMFGNHTPIRLPNSGVVLFVSPVWFQPAGPFDERETKVPDLYAPPSFEAYVANRDPALEAVSAHRPDALYDAVATAWGGGSAAVVRTVRRFAEDPVYAFVAESRINAVGYRLLRAGEVERAVAVFRANVEVHPHYGNGWDSLGEALEEAGRREEAIEAYERAMEIAPTPHTARSLERLRRFGHAER